MYGSRVSEPGHRCCQEIGDFDFHCRVLLVDGMSYPQNTGKERGQQWADHFSCSPDVHCWWSCGVYGGRKTLSFYLPAHTERKGLKIIGRTWLTKVEKSHYIVGEISLSVVPHMCHFLWHWVLGDQIADRIHSLGHEEKKCHKCMTTGSLQCPSGCPMSTHFVSEWN